jgi:hypothetical protein
MKAVAGCSRRSDSDRIEQPVIRTGIAPAEDPSLFSARGYGKAMIATHGDPPRVWQKLSDIRHSRQHSDPL